MESSETPVLCRGRTVPKGSRVISYHTVNNLQINICFSGFHGGFCSYYGHSFRFYNM